MRPIVSRQNLEIVPKKIYFSILKREPRPSPVYFYFTIDKDPKFLYQGFCNDFGPPSLLQLFLFYKKMEQILSQETERIIIFYTSINPQIASNSALYICFFSMLYNGLSPKQALEPLNNIISFFALFRDISPQPSIFNLSILDCLNGIYRAIQNDYFSINSFNQEEWEKYEDLENGNMNWIIPGKLLAFSSPFTSGEFIKCSNINYPTVDKIIPTFQKLGITHIIRLNKQFYDASVFRDAGFHHTELYFPDGSTPPQTIVEKFLEIMDSDDVIALHCKAGLGRTGTLAACYLIKKGFTASEAIAWVRICRPGSIMGMQQTFLLQYQGKLEKGPSFSKVISVSNSPFSVINSSQFETILTRTAPSTPSSSRSCRFERSIKSSKNNSYFSTLNSPREPSIASSSRKSPRRNAIHDSLDKEADAFFEVMAKSPQFQISPSKGFKIKVGTDNYCNNPKIRLSQSKKFSYDPESDSNLVVYGLKKHIPIKHIKHKQKTLIVSSYTYK